MEISAPLGVRKGAWTSEEDELLKKCIEEHGVGNWHKVPSKAGLNRCRKSCRLRWLNYLNPNIKMGKFSSDEVDLMIRLHKLLGNRWSLIAGRLPGRTSNAVKNYWNTHQQKKSFNQREEVDKVETDKKINTKVFRPQPHAFSKDLFSRVNNLNSENLVHNGNSSTKPSPESSLVANEESWWDKMLLGFENDNENKYEFSFDTLVDEQTKDHWVNEETGTSRFASGKFFEEGQESDWKDNFTKNIDTWDFYDDEEFFY